MYDIHVCVRMLIQLRNTTIQRENEYIATENKRGAVEAALLEASECV